MCVLRLLSDLTKKKKIYVNDYLRLLNFFLRIIRFLIKKKKKMKLDNRTEAHPSIAKRPKTKNW